MKTVHLIHGIHTAPKDVSTPELLIPEILKAGYKPKNMLIHDYGYALGITARWKNAKRAEKIAALINPGDIIIAHSNGCLITLLMLKLGISPAHVILLQPALDTDTVFPLGNYKIDVLYNEYDKVTLMARWLLWFHHPYGAMGRYGYKGSDDRVENHNTITIANVGGHSKGYEASSRLRKYVIKLLKTGNTNG